MIDEGGGCTVQQALTPEAASVVKQAVSLARRRGHAQVTPIHVANATLSSSTGLLRAACLQSHSHPLQCKALELCFNVALNRLPAGAASMLGPHHSHPPSLSNALVAAFKRAQAHQRRGSIESQQQPLLAVKIELEQLIISILDDPSVSRVMREAGFSSTQVKSNVQQAANLDNNNKPAPTKETTTAGAAAIPCSPAKPKPLDQVYPDDVASVVEILAARRKRSVVVVGECLGTAESVVRAVMEKINKGQVPDHTLRNVQFISLPIFSFMQMRRDEVDQKLTELRCLVKSCCVGMRAAVLYLGDLQWAAEYRASKGFPTSDKGSREFYCPVDHVIMEIGRILYGAGIATTAGDGSNIARFWLMGIATYQTYMKCRVGHPSVEALWGLRPITIPAGNLGLSLTTSNSSDDLNNKRMKSKRSGDGAFWSTTLQLEDDDGIDETNQALACCPDCSSRLESEVRDLTSSENNNSNSSSNGSLPTWLQQHKDETKRSSTNNNQEQCMSVKDIFKKWNAICSSLHPQRSRSSSDMIMNSLHFISSASPSSSITSFNQSPWFPLPISVRPPPLNENNFCLKSVETCVNPRLTDPNSIPSSDTMELEYVDNKFKELNGENLKILINALEKKVPWQKEIIPEIASTVLQCRSGMMRRKETSTNTKEETWLFFHGCDGQGKEKIARELANLIFGSNSTNLVSIGLSNFSSTRTGSSDDLRNKRWRSEAGQSYIGRLVEALRDNPHRVIVVEEIEQVDPYYQTLIKTAIETGRVKGSGDEDEVSLSDSIIILSCESFDSRSRACSLLEKHKSSETDQDEIKREEEQEQEQEEDNCDKGTGLTACFDLNVCADEQDLIMMNCSMDDVGLFESADRAFFFKLPTED